MFPHIVLDITSRIPIAHIWVCHTRGCFSNSQLVPLKPYSFMLIYIKAAIAQKEILQAESIHGSKKWLPRSHEASRQHLISWPGGGRQLNIYLHQTPFLLLDKKNHNCSKQEGVMCCNRKHFTFLSRCQWLSDRPFWDLTDVTLADTNSIKITADAHDNHVWPDSQPIYMLIKVSNAIMWIHLVAKERGRKKGPFS